jgi:hypothetical protein
MVNTGNGRWAVSGLLARSAIAARYARFCCSRCRHLPSDGTKEYYPVYVGSVPMFCAGTEVCSATQIFIRCELISRIVAIRNFSASNPRQPK